MDSMNLLNDNFTTAKLCYKLLDDKHFDKNEQIKEDYKFKLNFPEFGIINSKIPAKENGKFDTLLFLPEGKGRKGEGGLRAKGYFKFSYEKKDNELWIVQDGKFIKQIELDEDLVKNYEKLPLVSIVTVVYNGEKYLEETIQSVIKQTYPNIEYIIIDGGSTDGTLDIIKKYEDRIDYWVSEKDRGIYDAMNKGTILAKGAWINFMNAGDKFANNKVLENIDFNKYDNFVLIYGNKTQNNKIIYPLNIKKLEIGEIMACHQSMFFNKNILKDELYYDLRYKIYGDYELVNRIYKKNYKKLKYLNITISDFAGGGISSKISWQKRKDKYIAILSSYGIKQLIKTILYRISKNL